MRGSDSKVASMKVGAAAIAKSELRTHVAYSYEGKSRLARERKSGSRHVTLTEER